MAISDTYKTVSSASEGIYREKGSKFIAEAFPVSSEEEVRTIIADIRKKYFDARHHCYAYILGEAGNLWRANDDGEPAGTAGKPILGRIKSKGLTNVLVVVSRYFGGTLLGVSGLLNAYKTAAELALTDSIIIEKVVLRNFEIFFPYSEMNSVMKIIKEENLIQTDHRFDLECKVVVQIRLSESERICQRFKRINGLGIKVVQ